MLKIITNSLGSGDWVKVLDHSGQEIYCGHSIGPYQLKLILDSLCDVPCEFVEVNDEEME